MARKSKKPVLPGLSRSAACSTTCGRLVGHHGDHRSTLRSSAATVKPKAPARKARATKSLQCRISRKADGVRCSLRLGHKSLGAKHRYGTVVKVVPAVDVPRQGLARRHAKNRRFVAAIIPTAL